MKRLGRRGRALGQAGSDEELLDDETQKELLAGAGITSDVLEEMSVEERRGTLKAILASNPSLLPAQNLATQELVTHIVHGDSSDSGSTHSSGSSPNHGGSSPNRGGSSPNRGGSGFGVVEHTGRQLEVKSPVGFDLPASPSGLGDLVQVRQIMSIDRQTVKEPTSHKKSANLLDSDEEKLDQQEETQPYDLDCQGYLVVDTEVSPESIQHKLMMAETIPETQTVDSNPETQTVDSNPESSSQDESVKIASFCDRIMKPLESSRAPDTISAASGYLRLQPSVEVEQDVPLTRIYRAQQSQGKTIWPSFYAPSNVKDPDVYTDVIKLVFNIYLRRVCRAQKQMDQVARDWGKPVSVGCHVKGCLRARSSRLQDEQVQDMESTRGRALRRRYPQNQAQAGSSRMNKEKEFDLDEDDDFNLMFSRDVNQDLNSHHRIQNEKRKRQLHDEIRSSSSVMGCQHSPRDVIDKQHEDMVDSEEDESDEWIPVKVKRGSQKRNQAISRENKKQAQVQIREKKKKKKESDDKTVGDNVKLNKNVAGVGRKIKQDNKLRKEDDMLSVERCEFDAMLKGHETLRQKYVWSLSSSSSEIEVPLLGSGGSSMRGNQRTPESDVSRHQGSKWSQSVPLKIARVDTSDGKVEKLNTDILVVEEEHRNHKTEGDINLVGLMIDLSNSNDEPDSRQNAERTATLEKVDAVTVDVSSSQSRESLLDGQGNLYSTQLSRQAHKSTTSSVLASASSLQRTRRQGKTTSSAKNRGSYRKIGQLSVDSKVEVNSAEHEKQSIKEVKSTKDEKQSIKEVKSPEHEKQSTKEVKSAEHQKQSTKEVKSAEHEKQSTKEVKSAEHEKQSTKEVKSAEHEKQSTKEVKSAEHEKQSIKEVKSAEHEKQSTKEVKSAEHEKQSTKEVKSAEHEKQSTKEVASGLDKKQSMRGEASPPAGHDPSGMLSRLDLKQNTGNSGEDDDYGTLKTGSNQINEEVVVDKNSGDNNHDLKLGCKLLRSNRCLKRNPVVAVVALKRRKLNYSVEQKQTESYSVSEVCSGLPEVTSVESSPDSVSHPWPPIPEHMELLQDDGTSVADSTCPICGRYFHASKLEAHASSCGEDAVISVERDQDDEISCVKCAAKIPKDNIKEHQTHCLHVDVPVRRVTRSSRE